LVVGCGAASVKTLSVLVAPGALAAGKTIALDSSERHHLTVRRAQAGVDVLVLDGVGNVARGMIGGSGEGVTVGAIEHVPAPASLVLAVGAGDKERFMALAERCTELGVTTLVPLLTERSQAVDSRFRDGALEKARRRAREACKQSENPWATIVEESCHLTELAARYPGLRWLLAHASARACPPILVGDAIGWLIGPEGGLTTAEISFAGGQLGATTVGLSPVVLRFDTAAVAAAAITQDRRLAPRE
jgi:16S rRNA (uracil1498-N3)-methyltransferase